MYLASRKLCGTTNIIVWDRQKNKPQMKKIKKKFPKSTANSQRIPYKQVKEPNEGNIPQQGLHRRNNVRSGGESPMTASGREAFTPTMTGEEVRAA